MGCNAAKNDITFEENIDKVRKKIAKLKTLSVTNHHQKDCKQHSYLNQSPKKSKEAVTNMAQKQSEIAQYHKMSSALLPVKMEPILCSLRILYKRINDFKHAKESS